MSTTTSTSAQPLRAMPQGVERVNGAVRTHLHVAVLDGPDSGWAVALDGRGVVVGRSRDADLPLNDEHLSRRHLQIRHRGGRLQARDLDSVNGTRRRRARRRQPALPARWRRRTRRIGRRWRHIRPGDLLHAGATVLHIRQHPSLRRPGPHRPGADHTESALPRLIFPVLMCAGMIPMVLASGAGPWRLALVLLMPIGLAVAVLWPVLAQRRRARADRGDGPDRSAPGSNASEAGSGHPPAQLDPAALLLTALRPRGHGTDDHAPDTGDWPAPPEPAGQWEIGTADAAVRPPRALGGRRAPAAGTGRVPAPGPGQGLALIGAPADTGALARYLVCQSIVLTPPGRWQFHVPPSWSWTTALPAGLVHTGARPAATGTSTPPASVLRVLDLGATGARAGAAVSADPAAAHLVLARHLGQVPHWCDRIIEVRAAHNRRVCPDWARTISTVWSRAASSLAATTAVPPVAPLQDLPGPHTAAEILQHWRTGHTGLATVIGRDAGGPVHLDLAREGPHAVVAGTTGSGKSELLLAWVLALAARYPPGDLALLLVDYKGGATFAPIADVPHVVGMLTDLDGATTSRALASLRAELHRRERILARARVPNLQEYRAGVPRAEQDTSGLPGTTPEPMPRLMVIVDEFRVLSDEHPEHLDALVRLAAQGRSLGIHLVLATQRPAGAISADMRANLTTRLCLRVLDEADSADTIGTTAAARLPPVPGRAILRTGTTTTFQSAWCGDAEDVTALVQRIGAAARELLHAEPWRADLPPPWAPALPESLDLAQLPGDDADHRAAQTALPWLRTDLPEEQRLGVGALGLPARIVISGPPGSGRTTAAATLAHAAVRRGMAVHVLADSALAPARAPAAGTWCTPADARRARRLLTLLRRQQRTDLLIIDDVDAWTEALDEVCGPGGGTDLLHMMLRQSRRTGLSMVLTAPAPAHRWAAQTDQHLVLAPRDASDAAMAGVPADLIGTGWPPGRGVLLTGRSAVLSQVALARGTGAAHWPEPTDPVLRLQELPARVDATGRPAAGDRIWLGIGGDEARWVGAALPEGGTWLVAGSGGSGRSTTLAMIETQVHNQGRTDVLVLDDADRLPPARVADVESRLADHRLTVVAAADPDRLLGAYHGLATRLRDPDVVIALSAVDPHLTGVDIRAESDPGGPPGRAVLVDSARVVPVQLAHPG